MVHRGEGLLRLVRPVLIIAVVLGTLLPTRTASGSEATVERIHGPDRYATAAAISRDFPAGSPVFVATGANFPDSLAGGPAAARNGAPILLTAPSKVPDATRNALSTLRPSAIYVLGGPAVVSDGVLTALRGFAPTERISGANRYDTGVAITRRFFPTGGVPVLYVATGETFPDALSAGVAAAVQGGPLLLVKPTSIPASVWEAINALRPQRIVIAGGPNAVSDGVMRQLAQVTGNLSRLWGPDRYSTATAISRAVFGSARAVHLATGLNFPDAVAAAPAAARSASPLLLTQTATLPATTVAELTRLQPTRVAILGGPAVVSDAVYPQIAGAGGYTLVGQHAFKMDTYSLPPVPAEHRAFNAETIVPPYGQLENNVYKWIYNGAWVDHPVGQAQYVVNMLRNYRLEPLQQYLDIAMANANRLLERAVRHQGAIFFPYPFDYYLHGRGTLRAPWYSGMAQGIALSGFVRLYELTGDNRWLQAAHETYASFKVSRDSGGPWVTSTDNGRLWLELYPWQPLDHTYNGHNFAIYGLYDYWGLTGNTEAHQLMMGALTTSMQVSSTVRVPGGVMNYCISASCLDRQVRNPSYHLVVIGQMVQLFKYTGDERFAALADAFTADSPNYRIAGTAILMPGEHIGYTFDGSGVPVAARSASVATNQPVAYDQRTVPYGATRPGNGVWLSITEGELAGTWVRESTRAFARGYVDRLDFYRGRPISVAGGDVVGYRFAHDGSITELQKVTTAPATWQYAQSARINGQQGALIVDGPLAGYWVPMVGGWTAEATSVAATAGTMSAFGGGPLGDASFEEATIPGGAPASDEAEIPPPMPGWYDGAPDVP